MFVDTFHCVFKFKLLLVKRQGWGFTLKSAHSTVRLLRKRLGEEYLGNIVEQKFLSRRTEGVIVGWRMREVGAGMSM